MENDAMSEGNLVNVWIYPYLPNEWHCQTFEGMVGIGKTRDEAKATFDRDWNQRAPYTLIEAHPPRPKRPGDPVPAAPAIEGIPSPPRSTKNWSAGSIRIWSATGCSVPMKCWRS
jgi:hypothetical protein